MALNVTELLLIDRIICAQSEGRSRPSLLCLGYPDALADSKTWPPHRFAWTDLPKRENPSAIWEAHNRPNLRNEPMLETRGTLRQFGADVFIADAISWGGEDFILDLNLLLPSKYENSFDIIIDPGTLEHCFNIAQAFENIDQMLRPGGFVLHQEAIAFPNHGFWSISPTTFFDYYQPRGYELGRPHRFGNPKDENGLVPTLVPIDPFKPLTATAMPTIGSYIFRKPAASFLKPKAKYEHFPIQRIYSANAREIPLTDFFQFDD